ncbi:PREDICTED: uncharacterized protein K02A2.6-like, partial [Wasmannia auropunctata]|uniref:uncharacterized protein K02A2.6-like n=1 Tax=Wasmannia auropunctata TaxID=64793 RepID=UPI0005F07805
EQKKPAHTPLTTWPWPEKAWYRLHCDFLGPFFDRMYLVVIDAYSKWSIVIDFNKNTKSSRLIDEFKKLFADYGLPKQLITDNGRQFASAEFQEFLKRNGIKHSFFPPYHPATNGAAENFVNTFKSKVKKIVKGIKHCTTGESPAFLLFKRELKTRFDLLRSDVRDVVLKNQRSQIVARRGSRKASFADGDNVMVDNHGVHACKQNR